MSRFALADLDRVRVSRRRYGPVFTLPNGEQCGLDAFVCHLGDAVAEAGGSVRDLMRELGIEDDGACLLCDSGQPRTMCPSCGCIARCARCADEHDDSSICRVTRESAEWSKTMRDGVVIEPADRLFAIQTMAASYLRRTLQ